MDFTKGTSTRVFLQLVTCSKHTITNSMLSTVLTFTPSEEKVYQNITSMFMSVKRKGEIIQEKKHIKKTITAPEPCSVKITC